VKKEINAAQQASERQKVAKSAVIKASKLCVVSIWLMVIESVLAKERERELVIKVGFKSFGMMQKALILKLSFTVCVDFEPHSMCLEYTVNNTARNLVHC